MMKHRRRKWYQEDGEEGLNRSHCMDTKKDYGEKHEKHFLCFNMKNRGEQSSSTTFFFLSFHSYLQKKKKNKKLS
jgi:hypothetical protein